MLLNDFDEHFKKRLSSCVLFSILTLFSSKRRFLARRPLEGGVCFERFTKAAAFI